MDSQLEEIVAEMESDGSSHSIVAKVSVDAKPALPCVASFDFFFVGFY